MAADQRKRRLSSATTAFGYGFQEQFRAKKRDLRPPKYDFNFNTHVSLKWDDNGKRVVAKDDQIGISWRHLSSFIPSAHWSNTKLADVITVPRDVFELNDLADVLSYEVWQSVLTEKDRNFLTQFLPPGVQPDEVVQALLSGDNFYFGNPSFNWASSLCSGGLHPDAILQHEKSFKTNKIAYYSELQQYHDNMIRNLQNLKQTCASSNDPEAEIRQIMSRSRMHEKTILPDANGHVYHKPVENVAVMSESLSPIADEKLYYSDNQKLSVIRDAEIQKRLLNQELLKDKHEKSMVPSNGLKVLPRSKKAEKLQKPNLTPNEGAKYMSYVKISKKQHELVKNMRQSGSSIQSKALNRLLGNLDSSNVKPYEMFVEEEQNRIHEYWLNLANNVIPPAFGKWRNLQLMKRQMMDSLRKELEENQGVLLKEEDLINPYNEEPSPAHDEDDGETSLGTSEDHQDDGSATQDSISDKDEEESDPSSLKNESPSQNPPQNVNEENDTTSSLEIQLVQDATLNVNEESGPSSSMETQSLQSHPVNVNEDPSSSLETQSLQNIIRNVNEKLDASVSVENQSLHHPLNVNGKLDPSCQENQSLSSPLNIDDRFDPSSVENNSSMDNPPLNDDKDFTSMDLNAENNAGTFERGDMCSLPEQCVAQTSKATLGILQSGTLTSATAPNVMEISGSSLKNMWSSIGLPESYATHPTTLHTGPSGLCLRNPQRPQVVIDQPAQLIDLKSDMPGEDTTKDLLNRHTSQIPFYNPCPNRDRNELLHSLITRDSFHQQQKKPISELHHTNVLLESTNQFPGHFREQLHQPPFALDHHRQKVQSEVFMHQNIQDYSDNRYSIQGPEHFPFLNVRDWSNARLSNPIQPSQLSPGELLNHNWFASENRTHGGWSSSDSSVFPAPSLGSGSSSDQSLYSVLTQCNLHSRSPYSPVVSTEQMIPPTNYGEEIPGGIPMTSNALPAPVSPFDYLSGGETSTTLKNPNMGWMSLGHRPSGLHDPSGKPFLKSWHQ